ncbi:MAG: tRNA lysidine(34) synthetase TilS [Nocardioides sp.]|nr:tRNA lysidine(34) synthetase TilS [Nocardioides sp.]
MSLDPAVAAVRRGVRAVLEPLDPGAGVLVACSGGADSLSLLAATVFEGHARGLRVLGATVDHGLQDGSADLAQRVVGQMVALGADETVSSRVSVEAAGLGVEAAAREARYAVLEQMADHFDTPLVLLGHTRDDQAETVLMGLARGSGGRSIAGMRRGFDRFRRPLLDVTRAQTEAACAAEGIAPWHDPFNDDPRFTRSRVRTTVLPMLEQELGPGVGAALARTADQLRVDMEYLDTVADRHASDLSVETLTDLPVAIRRRVLHRAALAAGAPAADLTHEHVLAVESLLTHWRGQKWIDLPGPLRAVRRDGVVVFEPAQLPG